MKIKLQPGGKIVVSIIALLILYFLLSLIGFFKLFSPKPGTNDLNITAANTQIINRSLIVGFSDDNFCPGGIFANNGLNTSENSLFARNSKLNVKFSKYPSEVQLLDSFKRNGDSSGVDIAITSLDQLILNFSKISNSSPVIFLSSQKLQNNNFLIARSYITDFKYLAGKKIAVVKNSPMHFFLLELLKEKNVDTKNVKFIFTSDDQQSFTRLKSRWASALAGSNINILNEAAKDKNFLNLSTGLFESSNIQVMIVKENFLKKYPLTLKSFTEGMLQANDSLSKKPDLISEILKKYNQSGSFDDNSRDLVQYKISGYFDNHILFGLNSTEAEKPIIKYIEKVKKIWTEAGIKVFPIDPLQIYNTEVLRSISEKIKIKPAEINKIPDTVKKETKSIPDSGNTPNAKIPDKITKEANEVKISTLPPVVDKNKLTIYFAPDSYKIEALTLSQLDEFAKGIKQDNTKIDIFGNADSTGQDIYNFMISRWRSKAISDYLIQNHKISQERFNLVGNGSRKPSASNASEKGRKKNRRVDIIIKAK